MPKTDEAPLSKHSVRLYTGDLADLSALFPSIGANRALRTILRNYLRAAKENAANIQAEGAPHAKRLELDDLFNKNS